MLQGFADVALLPPDSPVVSVESLARAAERFPDHPPILTEIDLAYYVALGTAEDAFAL
ncbi:MAG: hypothetical protein VYE19_02525 [Chloroflexota bacterium]|uniref:Uncharacterized protein n=1 Tax=marine metagenome TaxID=408172 RepID=A0A381R0B8_9ZZZZ|nr:hypothetical protein [Chloroflexota bacterium]MEC9279560.1 hypothetical protein [Chloroflexota bacterium]MED5568518.1 hypothetical protein [Chloroflexota bacterium]MEE3141321.1 hypothetical protein [Chloroflexota bacterium]